MKRVPTKLNSCLLVHTESMSHMTERRVWRGVPSTARPDPDLMHLEVRIASWCMLRRESDTPAERSWVARRRSRAATTGASDADRTAPSERRAPGPRQRSGTCWRNTVRAAHRSLGTTPPGMCLLEIGGCSHYVILAYHYGYRPISSANSLSTISKASLPS